MSCGDPSSITYVLHPHSCNYSSDGSEAHRVNLRHLHWRHWGSPRATASGLSKDIHDQDHNGFQSHRVHVVVYGLKAGVYGPGSYYYKMRVSGISQVIGLYAR